MFSLRDLSYLKMQIKFEKLIRATGSLRAYKEMFTCGSTCYIETRASNIYNNVKCTTCNRICSYYLRLYNEHCAPAIT